MENSAKPWYKNWWGITIVVFLIIFLIFLVAFSFYFFDLVKNAKQEINLQKINLTGKPLEGVEGKDNYWLGSAKAKVVIVEFGDFACPVCEKSFSTIREISLKYKDDIKFIWRDYPVIQNYSATLALAARCAGEQGLFWPMHDKLFLNQGVNTTNQLNTLASQIGADLNRFKDCLTKQKYLAQIQQDAAEAIKFDIKGTPTWFINGYKVEGEIPYDMFINIIEGLLK